METITSLIFEGSQRQKDFNQCEEISRQILNLPVKNNFEIETILIGIGFSEMGAKILAKDILREIAKSQPLINP